MLFRCSAVCKWHNNTWQSRKCSSNKQCTARNSNEAIIQIFSWFLALPRLDCCKRRRRRRRAEGQHPVICEFLVSRFQKHLQAAPGLLRRTSYLVGVGRWPSLALICSLLLNEPHWNTTTCGGWWWWLTEGRWWCGKWVDWMSGSWNWECSWISPKWLSYYFIGKGSKSSSRQSIHIPNCKFRHFLYNSNYFAMPVLLFGKYEIRALHIDDEYVYRPEDTKGIEWTFAEEWLAFLRVIEY